MVGWQIERFTEDKKEEFARSNILKRLFCYPDTYHWETEWPAKGKMKLSIIHDVHKELQFNVYKGNIHCEFEPYFDKEETAYSILIKPVKVNDIDWIRRQNSFLFEFYTYMAREVKIRGLKSEDPWTVISKLQERALNNLVESYHSFLMELNSTRMGRRVLRDILGVSLFMYVYRN